MASILKVDDLRGNTSAGNITITSEGGAATMQLQQGVAKAWGGDMTDSAVAGDSFNISSIADSGTGINQPSWSSAFNNADYSSTTAATNPTNTSGQNRAACIFLVSTSSMKIQTFRSDNATASSVGHNFVSFGDLA